MNRSTMIAVFTQFVHQWGPRAFKNRHAHGSPTPLRDLIQSQHIIQRSNNRQTVRKIGKIE